MYFAVTPTEQIAAWLRASTGPLSGEEMARRLGCTRAAVQKHVAGLRRCGYRIDARRAQGYRLITVPDRLSLAEIAPHLTGSWRRIESHETIDSTQSRARVLAREGATEGATVIAETQTAGRGRLGRTWHSPAGMNLYCSIVLRPALAPAAVPQLALVAGLAVADAIEAVTALPVRIKWPNDVVIEDRKLAGILMEMDAELERVHYAIAGIGVNLNLPRDAWPPELRDRATSLAAESGRPVDRAAFAARLLAEFEVRYRQYLGGGLGAMRADWEARSSLTQRTVTVAGPAGTLTGRVLGLGDDGALRLDVNGREERVVAGEVTLAAGGYAR